MELIAKLEALNSSMAAAPWNENAMYEAIRHVQRNTEVMEYAIEYADEDAPKGTPDRYDGTALAQLRNLLPQIIEALKAAEAGK